MATVYGYGRASTDKQALTEDSQRRTVEGHVQSRLADHVYGGWLYDRAVSGKKPLFERDAGRRLWVLLQPGDHVVWAKLDRAFRSVIDGATTLQMLQAKGVFVHCLDLGLDTSTAMGRCITTILLSFAELEREYTSQRTKDSLREKRRQGRPYGKINPIGWKKVGTKARAIWMPCEDERAQVRQIVQMRTSGMSLEDVVCRMVNTRRPCGFYWNVRSVSRAVEAFERGFPKQCGVLQQPSPASA